jgi:uncharacterized protein YbjT (DUF2867 family)
VPTTDIIVTSRQPIAVLGATGNQGGHVAYTLLEAGWPVRAITRHPESPRAKALATLGAQVVEANMGDTESMIRAFDGAYGIFSVQNFWELGLREEVRLGTNVITAALAVGQPHVIYSSGLGAETVRGITAIDGKAMLEERLRQSGLPFTIVRPALFMDDFLGASLPFAWPVRAALGRRRQLVGRLFLATLRSAAPVPSTVPITTLKDVGRVAAWAWADKVISNKGCYDLVGDCQPASNLCREWETFMGKHVPFVPGIKLATRIFHRRMADLLDWLRTYPCVTTSSPFALTSFAEWLHSLKRSSL